MCGIPFAISQKDFWLSAVSNWLTAQRDILHFNRLVEEYLCLFLELLGILGSQVMHRTTFRTTLLNVRMALEILEQRLGYIFALRHNANATGYILMNLRQQDSGCSPR